jgi:hypothetical protein
VSKISLSGNSSGTGNFTIQSPATNTDRTLTLPDATGTVQVSGNAISGTTGSFSSDLSFNSGYGSAAVAYGCRAWVNFNGTGTVAIRGSGNVTSITDNNTGDYTVNFTTAMPDVNYMFVAGAQANGVANGPMIDLFAVGTTTTCRFRVFNAASATMDSPVCTFLAVR